MLALLVSLALGQVAVLGRDADAGVNRPILVDAAGEVWIANPLVAEFVIDGGLAVCTYSAGVLTCPALTIDGGLTVYGNAVFNGYIFGGNIDAGTGSVFASQFCTPAGGCWNSIPSVPSTTWWIVDGGVGWESYSIDGVIDAGNVTVNGGIYSATGQSLLLVGDTNSPSPIQFATTNYTGYTYADFYEWFVGPPDGGGLFAFFDSSGSFGMDGGCFYQASVDWIACDLPTSNCDRADDGG